MLVMLKTLDQIKEKADWDNHLEGWVTSSDLAYITEPMFTALGTPVELIDDETRFKHNGIKYAFEEYMMDEPLTKEKFPEYYL